MRVQAPKGYPGSMVHKRRLGQASLRAPAHRVAASTCARHPSYLIDRSSSRVGITLLEVLISIGVLSVGVLGAASLLPMATYFQNDAVRYDRGGTLGQQAFHDLQIKNYLSPRRWIFVDPGNPVASSLLGAGQFASSSNYTPLSAFVIDPHGFSYAAMQTPAVAFPCYFPAFNMASQNAAAGPFPGGAAPTVYRAGVTANDYWPIAATMPVASPMLMSFPIADRMMRSTDDVLFEYDPASLEKMKQALGQPIDMDQRPMAITSFTGGTNPIAALNIPSANAPNYAGEYSWIATVSRTPSDMMALASAPSAQLAAAVADLHRFQVSVVVMQSRDLTLWTGAGGITLEQPPPERQVYALFTQYAGQAGQNPQVLQNFYAGGGLQLYVYESSSPAVGKPSRHWLDNIKPNTYLMLSANFVDNMTAVGGASNPYPRLDWYKILNVDDGPNQDPNNPVRWYRNVVVSGADWPAMWYQWTSGSGAPITGSPIQLWIGADSAAANTTSSPVAFCTLIDNAINMYGPTPVTLDYSLLRQ